MGNYIIINERGLIVRPTRATLDMRGMLGGAASFEPACA